uniref:MSP domain-containing protein n=1 Tax=Panagrolaimus sp. PS1159 TaxID=55785 RepID=A0AC35GQ39_9BILA
MTHIFTDVRTNVCGLRIAWRIRSDAPLRYVVNPACRFLTNNEAQTIQIELSDCNKYSERHGSMVQAMEAKDDEKDRQKILKFDLVQSATISTSATSSSSGTSSSSSGTEPTSSTISGSNVSSASAAASLSEYTDRIGELTVMAKKRSCGKRTS